MMQCIYCDYSRRDVKSLRRHCLKVHNSTKLYKCQCDAPFDNHRELQIHKKQCSGPSVIDSSTELNVEYSWNIWSICNDENKIWKKNHMTESAKSLFWFWWIQKKIQIVIIPWVPASILRKNPQRINLMHPWPIWKVKILNKSWNLSWKLMKICQTPSHRIRKCIRRAGQSEWNPRNHGK